MGIQCVLMPEIVDSEMQPCICNCDVRERFVNASKWDSNGIQRQQPARKQAVGGGARLLQHQPMHILSSSDGGVVA